MNWAKLKAVVKLCASAIPGNAMARGVVCVASIRLAELLMKLVNSGFAQDLSRVRESALRRIEARTEVDEAKATKLVAEAQQAANQANLPKRRDAFALLERRRLELENAKTEAEIESIKADSETRRLSATAEAQSRLLEAIATVESKGGSVSFDLENLHTILAQARGLPSPDDEPGAG